MFSGLNIDEAASLISTEKDTIDRVLLAICNLEVGGEMFGFTCKVIKTSNSTFSIEESTTDIGELIKQVSDDK